MRRTEKQIRLGYNQVQNKIEELSENFCQVITTGTRSGSGKMLMQFYDLMVQIWGGSPATEPLPFGVQSYSIGLQSDIVLIDKKKLEKNNEQGGSQEKLNEDVQMAQGILPVLIDNKRNHLETKAFCRKKGQTINRGNARGTRISKGIVQINGRIKYSIC